MSFKEKALRPFIIILLGTVLVAAVTFTALIPFLGNSTATDVIGQDSSENSQLSSKEASSIASSEVVSAVPALKITSPAKKQTSVTTEKTVFAGSCDVGQQLLINGKSIPLADDGSFSAEFKLNIGENTFTVEYAGTKQVYTVNYRYVIINEIAPSGAKKYEGGSTMVVRATARFGSRVTATFCDKTITLNQEYHDSTLKNPEFIGYIGSFDLPAGTEVDRNLGKVVFKGDFQGKSESLSSGNITVKKNPIVQSDGSAVTPAGGKYMNVGSGYIAEVIVNSAETFNGNTVDDYSHPTNNYLPKGTVDYCSVGTVVDPASDREYRKLRCGKRVYTSTESSGQNVKTYMGTLPETNNVTVSMVDESARFTTLTLDVDWKAPFYFDLLPQTYNKTTIRDYTVKSTTYKYIDITFCYAQALEYDHILSAENLISEDNPLFSKMELIKNKYDCTLRLHLKRTGQFYGWDSYYNEYDQLTFEFLHPVRVYATDFNDYRVDLSEATVLIDVGHGGTDPGAVGPDGTTEAHLSLVLAKKISDELAKTGCRVVIDRTSNSTLTSTQRIALIKELKPDLVISVHRNSCDTPSVHAFNTYYYYPYSKAANDTVYKQTINAGLYESSTRSGVGWHYFFLGRVTNCPVILSENGYMSNSKEFSKMKSEEFNKQCAIATVKGIVDYFLSIQ